MERPRTFSRLGPRGGADDVVRKGVVPRFLVADVGAKASRIHLIHRDLDGVGDHGAESSREEEKETNHYFLRAAHGDPPFAKCSTFSLCLSRR